MLEQFSATIDKIYAAGAGGCRWQEALVAIEDFTGSAGAVIDLVSKSDAVTSRTLAGSFTEENCAEYARDYQAICPRIRFALQNSGLATQYDYLFMTETSMDRDPVYAWFGKHGLRYYLGSPVGGTPNYMTFVSVQRTRRQGHAQAEDVRRFDLLKPHLARATGLADQLGTLRTFDRFGSAMLEALPQAVFAIGPNGAVIFANGRAGRLAAAADGLAIEAGRLCAAQAGDQARLDALINAALLPMACVSASWIRISRPSGRLPYAVFVSPLNTAGDEELASAQAKVLVLVHDTSEQRCVDIVMLKGVYGLTETEARLASALSGGHSLQSAAALLHMQPGTARSHLKHVFHKFGVNRQQDLVRLLTSLSGVGVPVPNRT